MATNSGRSPEIDREPPSQISRPLPKLIEVTAAPEENRSVDPVAPSKNFTLLQVDRIYRSAHPFKKKHKKKRKR